MRTAPSGGGGGDCGHGNAVEPISSRGFSSVEFCQEVQMSNDVTISWDVSATLPLKLVSYSRSGLNIKEPNARSTIFNFI
jgi:hypothetical protein